MRRAALLSLLLTALAIAAPNPQDEPKDPSTDVDPTDSFSTTVALNTTLVSSSSITLLPNSTTLVTSSRTRKPHTEPIPIFTSACNCPKITAYPCMAYDALHKCIADSNNEYACHMMNRACPSPSAVCSDLYPSVAPPTPHPCDLGPHIPEITEPPQLL